MTANPFTAFPYNATGANQVARTTPVRLSDIHDVRDFGAVGDGVTDDWAAIVSCFNWTVSDNKGTIYFPPGTYLVSQPLDFSTGNFQAIFLGDGIISTITGNFSDYVFKRTQGFSPLTSFENLNVVNTNATGGGIRMGGCDNGAIRNCTVTANQGISTFNDDSGSGGYFGSLEISIESCNLTPGVGNMSGSQGLMLLADGPVINCRIIGYHVGLLCAGGEGAMYVHGCYFEQCDTAFLPGVGPDGAANNIGMTLLACWFKNNTIAMGFVGSASGCMFRAIRIEAATGQGPGGTNPQYGISDTAAKAGDSLFAGITVVGQYTVAGIYVGTQGFSILGPTFMGVQSVSWIVDDSNGPFAPTFIACGGSGLPFIHTVAGLPSGAASVEGDTYNVSDGTNSLAWGATITNTGSHATHYKVRYNAPTGTGNFTVVGQ